MTLEELMAKVKALLKDDAAADATVMDGLLTDYLSVLDEKTEGLKTNRDTILGEKKALTEEFNLLKEQHEFFVTNEVTPDSYKVFKDEFDIMKSAITGSTEKEKQFGELRFNEGKSFTENIFKPRLTEAETKASIAEKKAETSQSKYLNSRMLNKLNEALKELNAKPDGYWKQGFIDSAIMEYNEDTDAMDIQIKTPGSNSPLPLSDWMKQFPDTPEGKRIIPAALNLGGGANGGAGGAPAKIEDMGEYLDKMFH